MSGALKAALRVVGTTLLAGCALVSGTGTPTQPRVEVASWYGARHHGRPTASGEPFDKDALTAAHKAFPLGTCLEVVHLETGRRAFVRVNDRGPYGQGRTLDLSYRAAQELGMINDGVARVRVRVAAPVRCQAKGTGRLDPIRRIASPEPGLGPQKGALPLFE